MDKQLIEFLKNGGYIHFTDIDDALEFYVTTEDYCKEQKISVQTAIHTFMNEVNCYACYDITSRQISFKNKEDLVFLKQRVVLDWSDVENFFKKPQKEKETNMLKLLEMYKGRKTTEIEEKYDKQIHEIESNDAAQIFIEQAEQSLKVILNTENLKIVLNSDVLEYTQETIDAKNKIVDMIRKEKHELNIVIDEISALLELAPDFEQKMKILRDYGIIDKKKNIIL